MAQGKIAFFSKPDHPEIARIVHSLKGWLHSRDLEGFLDENTARALGCQASPEEELQSCRLAVVLGGDGTMLHVARRLAPLDIPILPINLGTLGFLTETPVEELQAGLSAILDGAGHASRRPLLQAELVRDGRIVSCYYALNDVVVGKGTLARIIDVLVLVDDDPVGDFRADGVIVSTPTGSTGYSLSAGGPILHPQVEALVITPVCPHALNHRPLVVRDTAVVGLRLKAARETTWLTVDGQEGLALQAGDTVTCRKSALAVTLVHARERSFFEILRSKLYWG